MEKQDGCYLPKTLQQTAFKLDQADLLSEFRQQFYLPEESIYLDGNSLGLLSKPAERAVLSMLDSWRQYAIDGWSQGRHPWFQLSEELSRELANWVGADKENVIATGSTTVNLHQLLATFYQPTSQRYKIVATSLDFPSDIYAIQSHLRLHGLEAKDALVLVQSHDGLTVREEDITLAMTDDVSLVLLPSVFYRSGQYLSMPQLAQAARQRGILIGFDLCHSIGIMPHELQSWDVDFAFWCHYKYLNAGPGSVAGLYVHPRHHHRLPGLAGWFGSDKEVQFDMLHDFTPAQGAGRFQIGTPHVLSLAPLLGSLEIFQQAGIQAIRSKSLQLTQFLIDLAETYLSPYGFQIGNPREPERRGGHVCLIHPEAIRICKAMKQVGVIPDYRAPDVVRLAPVPLYTSFTDVLEAVERIIQVMENKSYEAFEKQREVIA